MNEEREAAGLSRAANPRNAAAGTIRMVDAREVAKRRLDYYAYFLLAQGKNVFARHSEALDALDAAGFKVNRTSAGHQRSRRGAQVHSQRRKRSAKSLATRSTAWCSR